jgi:hypothetical protein
MRDIFILNEILTQVKIYNSIGTSLGLNNLVITYVSTGTGSEQ